MAGIGEGIAALATYFGASAGTAAAIGTVGTVVGAAAGAASTGLAIASAVSGPKRQALPPSPLIPQAQVNEQSAQAGQDAQRRAAAAGGLQSTVGGEGASQSGYMLSPSGMESKSLLGQ